MKHKWHDEIVAWAGGAEIECRIYSEETWKEWGCPSWDSFQYEFRIKPTPKEPTIISNKDILNAWEKFIKEGPENEKNIIAFARHIINNKKLTVPQQIEKAWDDSVGVVMPNGKVHLLKELPVGELLFRRKTHETQMA